MNYAMNCCPMNYLIPPINFTTLPSPFVLRLPPANTTTTNTPDTDPSPSPAEGGVADRAALASKPADPKPDEDDDWILV